MSRKLALLIRSDVDRRASGFGWSRPNGSGARCSGPGTPPQLEEVVSGAHQLPFGVACAQAPPGEPPDPADLLDVAEHRLNRVGSLGVERSPSFGRKLVLHDPSAGSPEHTSARDRATALVSLVPHGDE